jgi:hypothetical protein
MAEEVDFKLTPLDDNGDAVIASEEVSKTENKENELQQEEKGEQNKAEEQSEAPVQEELEVATVAESLEAEEKNIEPAVEVSEVIDEVAKSNPELTEDELFNILKERYNAQGSSIKDVLSNNEQSENIELTDDVKKFLEYQKDTGRGLQDFLKAQRDIGSLSDQESLLEYYKETKPHLSIDDISYLISEKFNFDESIDDEKEIRSKKIAFKEEVYKAKQLLNDISGKYKVPLESSDGTPLSKDVQDAISFYTEYNESTEKQKQLQDDYSKVFREKTEQVFSQNFKGFEFNVGDKRLLFKIADVNGIKSSQSDINDMLGSFTDKETGALGDGMKFHKAAFAMNNPDLIAKLAYQQGLSDATKGIVKETKNIDMSVRENQDMETKGSNFKVLSSESSFSSGLKFNKK